MGRENRRLQERSFKEFYLKGGVKWRGWDSGGVRFGRQVPAAPGCEKRRLPRLLLEGDPQEGIRWNNGMGGAGLRSHCQPHCPPLASSPTWPGHGYWAEGAQRGWDCPLHHCRGGPEHGEQRWTEGSRVYRPGCQSLTREDLAGQGGSHEQGGSYSAGATLTDFHVPPHDRGRKVLFCSPSS